MKRLKLLSLLGAGILVQPLSAAAEHAVPIARDYGPPPPTEFRPVGCRDVPAAAPVPGERTRYRINHADCVNADEVSVALPPMVALEWVSEADKYFAAPAVFDSAGNPYLVPLWPGEDVILIALDPDDGSRRWVIEGQAAGASSALVIAEPQDPGREVLVQSTYSETVAVATDGTVLWRKPSGLTPPVGKELEFPYYSFGTNYSPIADALVSVTGDGFVYALDRATGDPLLAQPYQLPGEPTPPGSPVVFPPPIQAVLDAELLPLIPTSTGLQGLIDALLGQGVEVGNFFAVDPGSGRIWVAATAPDEADGTLDGQSELGALYGLELVAGDGPPFRILEHCRVLFTGGSASTPTLDQEGGRVYLGDSGSNLLAIDSDCQEVWRLDVGASIVASVAVSADNNEIYLYASPNIVKVVDEGEQGTVAWVSNLDMYEIPAGYLNFNLLSPGVGANGVFFHGGAGFLEGTSLRPIKVGVGQLDRETGEVRSFVDGPEESIASLPTAPDGSLYLSHSPLRRAIARAIAQVTIPELKDQTAPLTGGVAKYGVVRADLLLRDAVCAASQRAANAFAYRGQCPDSASADATQIAELIAQALNAGEQAVADADLAAGEWEKIREDIGKAERALDPGRGDDDPKTSTLNAVATHLGKACDQATR